MRKITEEDFKKVDHLVNAFKDALLGTNANGEAAFLRKLSWAEKMKIGSAKLACDFARSADPNTRAEKLVQYCEAVVPALKRTFGESAIIKALPPESRTQEVCDLCDAMGGTQLSALIRKAL